jgi:hypothetical protein
MNHEKTIESIDLESISYNDLMVRKTNHLMKHPYAPCIEEYDLSKMIEVEVHG